VRKRLLSLAKMQNGPQKQDVNSFSLKTRSERQLLEAYSGPVLWQTVEVRQVSPVGESFLDSFNYAARS
jgi:hypothetical protein